VLLEKHNDKKPIEAIKNAKTADTKRRYGGRARRVEKTVIQMEIQMDKSTEQQNVNCRGPETSE